MKKCDESMPNLTQKIDFTESEHIPDELISDENVGNLKQLSQYTQEDFSPLIEQEYVEDKAMQLDEEVMPLEESSSRFFKTKLILAFFGMLVFSESFLYVSRLITDFDILDAAWLAFFLFILGSFITTGVNEYRSLKTLKKAESVRRQNHYFLNSNAIGNANAFCQKLCLPLDEDYNAAIEKWRETVLSHHSDKEVVELFNDIVIKQADEKAINIVRTQAAATAALIGVSPLASVDMIVVFVRHWQMINQVSSAYGLRLGYGARISLLKRIVKHMIYAGSSEILLEASAYALGSSLTAKLSTKVAQGLGAGALTGRLGLQVITQCRPVEWKDANKPTLVSLTKQILTDLRNL